MLDDLDFIKPEIESDENGHYTTILPKTGTSIKLKPMNYGESIEIEKMRSNLSAAVTATAQAIPAMAAQGQDPSTLIQKIADVIERRRNGDSIEAAALAVFAPEQSAQAEMTPPGTQGPVEATPSPVAPGQPSGGVPQQAPDLATILAGLGG